MEHPFINHTELTKKTLEQLQEGITSLNTKLTFAQRTGNRALIGQLMMVLESYRKEHAKKMDEIFAKNKLNTQINVQSDKKN